MEEAEDTVPENATGIVDISESHSNQEDTLPDTSSEEGAKDYIDHYTDAVDDFPPPPPVEEHRYDFDQQSSTSTVSEIDEALPTSVPPPLKPLGSMAELVVQGIENLRTEDNEENEVHTINVDGEKTEKLIYLFIKNPKSPVPDAQEATGTMIVNGNTSSDSDTSASQKPLPGISLFIKAGSDRECVGCCPFSQRLFMMLWLKGVVFNVTTVDKATKPKQLSDIAAGTNPPFLLFNGEELTDIQKCEDYIEAELYPPRYPKLACKHVQSNTIGNDIFAKFSAFIKFKGNANDPKRKMLETKLNDALRKFDKYLNEPLDDEIDENDDSDEPQVSKRKFIDGNEMTIADCNMLPKLNMIRVAGKEMLKYEVPEEFTGIARYLKAADDTDEFIHTCPEPGEIIWTYGGRKPRPGGWKAN